MNRIALTISTLAVTILPLSPVGATAANATPAPTTQTAGLSDANAKCQATANLLNTRSERLKNRQTAIQGYYANARSKWEAKVSGAIATNGNDAQIKKGVTQYQKDLAAFDAKLKNFVGSADYHNSAYDRQIMAFANIKVNCNRTTADREHLRAAIKQAQEGHDELVKNKQAVHELAAKQVVPDVKKILKRKHDINNKTHNIWNRI